MSAHQKRPLISGNMLRSARNVSDMLALWSLCREQKCRKAGTCRVTQMTCWHECLDLVPGPVLAFVFGLFESREEEKLSFKEALARIPEPWHEQWSIWHQTVARITGRPSLNPARHGARSLRVGG